MALPDKSSYAALAGELADYQPVVDPTTDLPAEAGDELRADNAAMTRMIARAYVAFTVDAGVCTVVQHEAVWGNSDAVKPEVAYGGAGSFTVLWPAVVADARGLSHSVNLLAGWGQVRSVPFTPFIVSVVPFDPRGVDCSLWSIMGAAQDDPALASDLVEVWVQ